MKKDYKKLELDKILDLLSQNAYCDVCRERIKKIKPSFDIDTVRTEIAKTDDAFTLSSKFGTPKFYNIKDICFGAKRAQQGSSLSLRELMDIGMFLREVSGLDDWYSQCSGIQTSLTEYFEQLSVNKHLENMITNAIISEEELADSASPQLAAIRRSIQRKSLAVRERLDKLIKSQSTQKYLQESLVTMRDGRFVVPVKTEYKSEISGLVHDTSATGATLFIEPMAVVEANNEIRVLQIEEQKEIERIIKEMSELVGSFAEPMINDYEIVLTLEIYFAKANLGAKMKAVTPVITDKPCFNLIRARHPLIDKDKVVPISLELGNDYSSLIVTGPNTGGKTVSLKTAGLLVLMAMCGMMIPASENSVIGMFDELYVDIGDEQSIEQSLSTFSAHMSNIVQILREVDDQSLLLFDELGAGTDPIEGAALAIAIIESARSQGALIAATTHYAELKTFAMTTAGVENASCEFDVQTLRPTYRLLIGIPGKSNAFAISRRLGLDESVIQAAQAQMDSDSVRFEDVLTQLEEKRQRLEKAQAEADRLWRQREEDARKARTFREQMEKAKDNARTKGEAEAKRIVRQAQAQADEIFAQLDQLRRQQQKQLSFQELNDAKAAVRHSLNQAQDALHIHDQPQEPVYTPSRPIEVGDLVELPGVKMAASVLAVNNDGTLLLQAGKMKMTVKAQQVRLPEGQPKKKPAAPASGGSAKLNLQSRAASELDIRGYETLEAESVVENYIDSAVMAKLGTVTIIHGKGTGALRKAVHEMLKRNKAVKSFRLGRYGEGEAGVTVVELK